MTTRLRTDERVFIVVDEGVLYNFIYSMTHRDWTCLIWLGPHNTYHAATVNSASDDPMRMLRNIK